jgi:TolB protein
LKKFVILLLFLSSSCIRNFEPVQVPDFVLFSSWPSIDPEFRKSPIYSINFNGSNLRKITNGKNYDWNPILTPDGLKIIFTRGTTLCNICIINIDGSNEKRLVKKDQNAVFPDVSFDGNFIAYENRTYDPSQSNPIKLYLKNLKTGESKEIINGGIEPKFSPVENKILYSNGNINIFNIDDSSNINLTNNDSLNISPRFSPDGNWIVFMSKSNSYSKYNIWIMESNGENKQKLTQNIEGENTYPEFSQDGTKIVYKQYVNRNHNICIMNTDGTGKIILNSKPNPIVNFTPKFSRNGDKILFHNNRDNNVDIFVMDLDGSNLKQLTTGPNWDIFRVGHY